MPLIGIQAGHQNIQLNCDLTLQPETGATGEETFNVAVRDTLGDILIAYGFEVQLDDANANCNPGTIGKDFDFYLAIHAEGAPQGGAISAPDPSVDAVNDKSQRICSTIASVYFPDTGITNTSQIVDPNMTFYYMWNVLTAKTPCGIIECGDLQDPHDSVILNDHRRVALGIAHGICLAFAVTWKGDPLTVNPAPIPDPCALYKTQLTQLQQQFDAYKQAHPIVITTVTQPTNPGFFKELSILLKKYLS